MIAIDLDSDTLCCIDFRKTTVSVKRYVLYNPLHYILF